MGVVTGTFQYPNGSPVASGVYQFKLSQDAIQVSATTACIVPPLFTGSLDANGNLTATFLFNDVLSTTAGLNTTYQLTVKANGGGQVWNEQYYLTGTAANLNLIPPGSQGPPVTTVTATTTMGAGGGGFGALQTLENGVPDQTGNSFYQVVSLSGVPWFCGHWEFATSQTASSFISYYMRIPTTMTASATWLVECFSADTASRTAVVQTSDGVVNAGNSMNLGSLAPAPAQTYTSATTAYQRQTLSFPVQSTLTAGAGMLICNVTVSPFSLASNLMIMPYLRVGP